MDSLNLGFSFIRRFGKIHVRNAIKRTGSAFWCHSGFLAFVVVKVVGNRHSPGGDFAQYLLHASNLILGYGFDTSVVGPAVYPGYPLFLAPLLAVFGFNFLVLGLAQAVFWALSVEFSIRRLRIYEGRFGILIRLALLMCPPVILWADEIIPTVVYSALLLSFTSSLIHLCNLDRKRKLAQESARPVFYVVEVALLGVAASMIRIEFFFCALFLLVISLLIRSRLMIGLSLFFCFISLVARMIATELSPNLASYGSVTDVLTILQEQRNLSGLRGVVDLVFRNSFGLLEMSVRSAFFFDARFSAATANLSVEKLFIYGAVSGFFLISWELAIPGNSRKTAGKVQMDGRMEGLIVVLISLSVVGGQFAGMILHSFVDNPPNRYFLHVLPVAFLVVVCFASELKIDHEIPSFVRRAYFAFFAVPLVSVALLWTPRWGDFYVRDDFSVAVDAALDGRCATDSAIIYYKPRVLALKSRELGERSVVTWSSREIVRVSEAIESGTTVVLSLDAPSNYRQRELYDGLTAAGFVEVAGSDTSFPVFAGICE